ncbi:SHOCT domain-containing protein [Nocardiopsis sp. CC223A]|uniref:SHOCT domain-containing protein n=1 Tax=Nocardiopsis sp. CC223A TaxID=3044051 RepID=UPI00278BBEAF|nr:SHOCT domain-containing protein [Nocardiopsis sp. CC223A]
MTGFFVTVVILVLVVLGVYLVVTVSASGRAERAAPDRERPRVDRAQEELRLRYARGEIGREEYLQRKIDLE